MVDKCLSPGDRNRTWLIYIYCCLWGVGVKELGEYLKTTRVSNGVRAAEAAEDLELSLSELENIESGNIKAFKDVYTLKQYVSQYAKYLGLDPEKIVDEFNGFLFEHTSKISIDDIKAAQRKLEDKEKKVKSPYTKIYKQKSNFWLYVFSTFIFALIIALIIFIIINAGDTPERTDELSSGIMKENIYEFTY